MNRSCALSDEDIDFVNHIARHAGSLAMEMRSRVTIAEKTSPGDFVTEADVACSRFIVDKLRTHFPDDGVICEEESASYVQSSLPGSRLPERIWVIDPIDGTENYIANDGMYSVMIGLLINRRPAYGWVCNPVADTLYVACPDRPLRKFAGHEGLEINNACPPLGTTTVKLMMGNRDRQQHRWVETLPGIEFVYSGSVGLRVGMIIEDRADVYLHLAGKLKIWDTVAPVAMALSAGLDIGSFEADGLAYPPGVIMHEHPIVMGRPGTLSWMRECLRHRANAADGTLAQIISNLAASTSPLPK